MGNACVPLGLAVQKDSSPLAAAPRRRVVARQVPPMPPAHRTHNPNRRWPGPIGRVVVVAACLAAPWGCGSPTGSSLDIAAIEQGRIRERFEEISLGEFSVPIPMTYASDTQKTNYRTFMLMRFKLWALAPPHHAASVKRLAERNRGVLRDRVMTTCRRAPIGDLQDPYHTALRSRLLDELQPLFEGQMLRRVFMGDVLTDPM